MAINKEITFSKEGRRKLQSGIDIVANAVKVTLGARGRNVIIDREPFPHVTKDGVTVANEINLEDPIENMGARLIKQVASKTASDSGDGTTSSTVLAQKILSKGLESIDAGANPVDVLKGMNKAVEKVVAFIKGISIDISDDKEKLKQVAKISANGDEEIAELVSTVMSKVKTDGSVSVNFSNAEETRVEMMDGAKITSGYISPYFINNPSKRRAEYNDMIVFLHDGHLGNIKDFSNMLEVYYAEYPEGTIDAPAVLIVCTSIDGEALTSLVNNKVQGGFISVVVALNGTQSDKTDLLNDIQSVVGGRIISPSTGLTISSFDLSMFGNAKYVVATSEYTTIMPTSDFNEIEKRSEVIKSQIIEEKENPVREAILKGRLARLNGGVATIYVGGKTQAEMLERKDRIDDAVGATTAAMLEGVVPGGGVTLFRAMQDLDNIEVSNPQENIGVTIIKSSLSAPLLQILHNGGYTHGDGSKSIDSILQDIKSKESNFGFNISSEKVVDMIEEGIIDPAKVVRNTIENSTSIAGLLLTTEVVINNKVKIA